MNQRSQKAIGIFLLIISALLMLEHHLGRLPLGYDNGRQYVAAKQLSIGNGLVYPEFNPADLSDPILHPRSEFPPGVSVLTAPLFWLSDDIRVVHTIFALGNLLLFLWLAYRIVAALAPQQRIAKYLPYIFFFFALNNFFVHHTASSDIVCLNLAIGAGLLLIRYFDSERQLKYLAAASFLLVLCTFFRYAYLPALIVLPAFFLWRTAIRKQHEVKELVYSVGFKLAFAIPIVGLVLYNSSRADYITEQATNDATTLYWENLVQANPFPMETFFGMIQILKLLGINSDYGYDRGYIYSNGLHFAFYAISIIILIPVAMYFYHVFKNQTDTQPNSVFGRYGLTFAVALIGLIALGSIIGPSQYEDFNWSWAKVLRYYTFPAFLIQLTYFLIIIRSKRLRLRQFAGLVLISSLLFTAVFRVYNYTHNYRFFDFEHNTGILNSNESLLNTYRLHCALPANAEPGPVLFMEKSMNPHLALSSLAFGLNNATMCYLPDSVSVGDYIRTLDTSKPVDAFHITSSETANASLTENFDVQPFAQLPNGISVFRFSVDPRRSN